MLCFDSNVFEFKYCWLIQILLIDSNVVHTRVFLFLWDTDKYLRRHAYIAFRRRLSHQLPLSSFVVDDDHEICGLCMYLCMYICKTRNVHVRQDVCIRNIKRWYMRILKPWYMRNIKLVCMLYVDLASVHAHRIKSLVGMSKSVAYRIWHMHAHAHMHRCRVRGHKPGWMV